MANKNIIGYSNGIKYILIDYNLENNTGLVQLDGWIFSVWCKFDKIEVIKWVKQLKNTELPMK